MFVFVAVVVGALPAMCESECCCWTACSSNAACDAPLEVSDCAAADNWAGDTSSSSSHPFSFPCSMVVVVGGVLLLFLAFAQYLTGVDENVEWPQPMKMNSL